MKRYRVSAVICLGVALVLAISEVAILIVPGWYFDLPTVMRDMILIPFFGLAGAALWVFGTPFEERKRAFCQLLMPVVILYVIALFVALFGTSGFYREAGGTRSYNLTPFRTIRFYVEAYDNFAVRRRVVAANLCGNLVYGINSELHYRASRCLSFLPLAHAYGCAFDFLCCLAAGGHSFLIGRTPAPKILLKAFADVKPTLILSVPLILEKIYKKMIVPQISKAPVSWVLKIPYLDEIVLGKIRETLVNAFGGEFQQIIIGGAPLNAEVEAFLKRIKFPVSVGYGMTECAPLISFTPWESYKTFSCGQALPGLMEARIANPDQDGVGEIEVRGENVMYGYYKNDEATRLTFSNDGWLKTGDLGTIDEDGFIFIKGRNKTMLLGPSGQNIYPEEIESKLDNMPYVSESLVLQNNENQLVALVFPDMEAADANGLSEAQLEEIMEDNRKALNPMLASYEPIAKIKIYPHEFEKTPKKSIKRFLYTSMAD